MPIPQFHRTPKTRKRRTRRAPPAQERFDVQDMELENTAINAEAASSVQAMELDENCALVQRGSANDDVASPPDEVPALLSGWPPRSK
jgi:hypothetical protein